MKRANPICSSFTTAVNHYRRFEWEEILRLTHVNKIEGPFFHSLRYIFFFDSLFLAHSWKTNKMLNKTTILFPSDCKFKNCNFPIQFSLKTGYWSCLCVKETPIAHEMYSQHVKFIIIYIVYFYCIWIPID